MTIYDSINNASSRGAGSLILGLGSANITYDATTCTNNTFTGQFIAQTMTANAASNTGSGYACFGSITSAARNSAYGASSLISLLTGNDNIAFGYGAGSSYISNQSSNIVIGNPGVVFDNHAIRIGVTGNSDRQQNAIYLAAISNNELMPADIDGLKFVLIDPSSEQFFCTDLSAVSTIVTRYDTFGTYTWTKNARTKSIRVYAWSGGSGGGSGRKETVLGAGGGSGGSAGSVFVAEFPASFAGDTETVIVGAGGAGGAPQTSSDSNGNAGNPGEASSFGNLIPKVNSVGGDPGVFGDGSGRAPWIYIDQQLWSAGGLSGHPLSGSGTRGTGNSAEDAGIGLIRGLCPTGGGGGAGIDVVAVNGGSGGNILTMDGSGIYLAGGINGYGSDGGNGSDALSASDSGGILSGGTGGGGAGSKTTGPSYLGGDGGFPGGGGGGGSGGINGSFDSGAGGHGANGLVIVMEFL